MILDPQTFGTYSGAQLVEQIVDQLEMVCGRGISLDEDSLDEVGRAVEEALRTYGVHDSVDSVMLVSLVSRALSAIGEDDAARRLFLLGSGALRPSEWTITGDRTIWVLDLKRLAAEGDAVLEMRLVHALNIILDTISDVWDEADGEGYLGLVNLPAALRARRRPAGSDDGRLQAEVLDRCAEKLRHISAARGWADCPAVLNLDLRR